MPLGATLYVNGNRARNPYRQDLAPGAGRDLRRGARLRIARHRSIAGARRRTSCWSATARFELKYRQRSGRRELLACLGGAGRLHRRRARWRPPSERDLNDQSVSSVLLATGGGISGAALGILLATPLVPDYIPDNRALFIIGGMWIGAVEGFGTGVVGYQIATRQRPLPAASRSPAARMLATNCAPASSAASPGWGSASRRARCLRSTRQPTAAAALIQSAARAARSAVRCSGRDEWKPYGTAGGHCAVRQEPYPRRTDRPVRRTTAGRRCLQLRSPPTSALDLVPGALIGLNVGLVAGLIGAYVPDQHRTTVRPGSASCSLTWPWRPGRWPAAMFGCVAQRRAA